MYEVGEYIVEGLKNGITNSVKSAKETVTSMGNTLIGAAEKVFKVKSPSERIRGKNLPFNWTWTLDDFQSLSRRSRHVQ